MWNLFKGKQKKNVLVSPVNGRVIALSEVGDEAFSSGSMGEGFAVEFNGEKVVSPVDGKVEACFPTGHAFGIHCDFSDVIVHVGIDTVELQGDGFHVRVKEGDTVKKGDILAEVDASFLKEKGYDATTMVVLTTGEALHLEKEKEYVQAGEEVGYAK